MNEDKRSSESDELQRKGMMKERGLSDNHGSKEVTWKVDLENWMFPSWDSSSECSGTESNLTENVSLDQPVSLSLGEIPDSSQIPSVTNFEINQATDVLLEFDTTDERATKFRDLPKEAGLNKVDLEFEYTQRIPKPSQATIDQATYTVDNTTTNAPKGQGTYVIRTHDDDDDTDVQSDWDYDDLPEPRVISQASVECQTGNSMLDSSLMGQVSSRESQDLTSNNWSAEEQNVSGDKKEEKIEIRIRASNVFRNIFNKFVPKKWKLKSLVQVVPMSTELEELSVDPEDSSLSEYGAMTDDNIKTKLFKSCWKSCFPYLYSSWEDED